MTRSMLSLLAATALLAPPAIAQTQEQATPPVPAWMQEITPQAAQQPAWEEFLAVFGDSEIPAKYKELIALAVAGQIPCDYCVHYHTTAAQGAGATDEEIREALAVAGQVRKWSTILNGSGYDFEEFVAAVESE